MLKCSLLFLLFINIFTNDDNILQEIIYESEIKYQFKIQDCSDKTCPAPNSFCISSQICQCSKKYAQLNNSCKYERKIQLYAFLLEIIFSFGFGHLYSMRIAHAGIKMSLELILIMIYVYYKYTGNEFKFNNETCCEAFISIISVLLLSLFLLLHIYDIMMFSMNRYKDGAGISLVSWSDRSD